jgi:chromosome partitioning protein
MRTIAIINQKGGVGKTTTAVNLSAALADRGRRVCLIDLDAQAHASLHLGVIPDDQVPTIYDVMLGDAEFDDALQRVGERLYVLPSHLDLAAAEVELAGEVGRELVLRDRLATSMHVFDELIIDCPPSLGVLTLNALCAVKEVFLPLQPHFLALHGLSKLLRTIEVVSRRLNGDLRLSGIIMCMYETGTRLAAEVSQDVEAFVETDEIQNAAWSNVRLFETRIRRNIRLAEAPSFGQSIFEYAATSAGAEDYRVLADEYLETAPAEFSTSYL